MELRGAERQGQSRQAWRGKARLGGARHGKAGADSQGLTRQAWLGAARHGSAVSGMAGNK